MFSQASICSQGGDGVVYRGCLPRGDVCLEGVCPEGVSGQTPPPGKKTPPYTRWPLPQSVHILLASEASASVYLYSVSCFQKTLTDNREEVQKEVSLLDFIWIDLGVIWCMMRREPSRCVMRRERLRGLRCVLNLHDVRCDMILFVTVDASPGREWLSSRKTFQTFTAAAGRTHRSAQHCRGKREHIDLPNTVEVSQARTHRYMMSECNGFYSKGSLVAR